MFFSIEIGTSALFSVSVTPGVANSCPSWCQALHAKLHDCHSLAISKHIRSPPPPNTGHSQSAHPKETSLTDLLNSYQLFKDVSGQRSTLCKFGWGLNKILERSKRNIIWNSFVLRLTESWSIISQGPHEVLNGTGFKLWVPWTLTIREKTNCIHWKWKYTSRISNAMKLSVK